MPTMVSPKTRTRMILVTLAILVLSIPFIYPPGCRIEREQMQISVTSTKWIVGPEGGVLTMRIAIENKGGCDVNLQSLRVRIYRLIYGDNTTEDVDLVETQGVPQGVATISAGGRFEMNYGFAQPFSVGPRAVLAKITVILEDGSSLEVFDGEINTTAGA